MKSKESEWIKKFEDIVNSKPDTLSVFCNESGFTIFEGKIPITNRYSVDPTKQTLTITPKDGVWETGSW